MLVRITWFLVLAALGTLIGGFITRDSNVLLFISIGLALAVIVLVLVSWARRAREGVAAFGDEVAVPEPAEESDELFTTLEHDEFAVGGRGRSRTKSRPARRKSTSKSKAKSPASATPKAKAKAKAKPKAASRAKPKAKPKAKPQRRRPPSTSSE